MAIRRIPDASAHISNTNNPHLTTASQVGAYSITETDELLGGKANTSHVHAISDITNLQTSLDAKQAALVSGTNIKTINGESVLGSGNIVISGSGGSTTLDGLSDVTITTPSSGQSLQYNGTSWVNATPSPGVTDHGLLSGLADDDHIQYFNQARGDARYSQIGHTHAIDDISDVTLTAPSSGQVLQYNGTVWVNATPSSGDAGYTYTTTAVSKTLVDRERVSVTAASLTITLPATPVNGTEVWISVDNFSNTVVARNGSTILGVADDYIINKAYATVGFYYHNNTWRVF
jgi:hypothetical protein